MRKLLVWWPRLPADFARRCVRAGAICGAALIPIIAWLCYVIALRTQVLTTAEADERRITEIVGQQTLRVFEKQALILDLVDREAGDRDCTALRSDPAIQSFMKETMRQSAKPNAVWVMDADGVICASSGRELVDNLSRSFRDYFKYARTIGFDHYYVDRGVVGMITHTPIFGISRPRDKAGAFNGVVLVSINVNVMRNGWDGIIGGSSRRVSIFRKDGAVVVRSADPAVLDPDPEKEAQVASFWQAAPEGSVVGLARLDRTRRVGAWRSLPEWGVVVTSSVDENEVLQPWRRSATLFGVIAILMSTALGASAWSLLSRQERLARIVEERTGLLRQSADEFRTLAEGLPALCWMARPDGDIYWFNQRWYDYTGTTYAQMAGWGWGAVHDPVVLPAVLQRWRSSIATGTPFEMTFPLRRADGVFRPFLTRIVPELDAGGRVCRWLGTNIDVTDATEREAALERVTLALRENETHLENRVIEEVRAHEQALLKLAHAEKLTALGRLAGGMAHDFNNVLQAVGGAAELLESEACDGLEVRELSRTIAEASRRGASVSRRLLNFSHQDSLRTTDIDVASLLEAVRAILRHTVGAGIEIIVDIEDGVPNLRADKSQLETMLVNLATNARDAMPAGGTLTFAVARDEIRSQARDDRPSRIEAGSGEPLADGPYVRLSVSDTGVGMDARVLARACEPFFTTKDIGKGTGLGLAMAQRFAEQSGGRLQVTSVPGRGTTVECWFPITPIEAPLTLRPEVRKQRPAVPAPRHSRLLMVDDDGFVRKILARQMEAEGFIVLTATGGEEALAMLDRGEAVDLLISDYSMPGMDGATLVRAAHERRPLLPAILLTGFTENAAAMATAGAMSGLFTLLQKPITGAALARRVAILLKEATGAGVPFLV